MLLAVHIGIWGMALVMTGIAAFIKRYPHYIAGYNSLSPEKKKKVDLKGMARYLYKGMLIVSWSMVPAAYLAAYVSKNQELAIGVMAVWLIVGILAVAIGSERFFPKKKRKTK